MHIELLAIQIKQEKKQIQILTSQKLHSNIQSKIKNIIIYWHDLKDQVSKKNDLFLSEGLSCDSTKSSMDQTAKTRMFSN